MRATSILKSYLFRIFAIISLFEGILVMVWTVSIPADPKNVLFLGFSLRRLFLIGCIFLGLALITTVLTYSIRKQPGAEFLSKWIQNKIIIKLSGLAGLTLLLSILVPLSEWGKWEAVFERMLPLIIWFCLMTIQWFIFSLIAIDGFLPRCIDWFKKKIKRPYKFILAIVVILLFVYILSTFMYPNGMKEDYWYETGVPILGWQIIICIALILIYQRFEKQILVKLGRHSDLKLFFLIIILSGFVWGTSRLTPSFFNPVPLPPNNIFYPYSDAATFDLQAQSTLLGLGFDAGTPLDRPFYPMFLAIIHLIVGQDYSNVVKVQAFLFGVFPGIVYLICAQLGSRKWGVITSAAITFWGINAIQVNNILNTSTPKQMLTDFPMAIVLSLLLIITILWLKRKSHSAVYAFITGGVLAMSVFVRYSALLLLPIWMIIALFRHRLNFINGIKIAGLILAGFLIFTLPWYTRNIVEGQRITIPFMNKVRFVIQNRIESTNFNNLPRDGGQVIDENTDGVTPHPDQNGTNYNKNGDENRNYDKKNNLNKPFLNWFPTHLVHNIMSSILILPTSLEMAPLRTSLNLGGEIWQQDWDGRLPFPRIVILMFQFFVLSVGFLGIFKKDKTVAIIVVLLFGGIQLSNALGRTSGGRYIVPVDWLVLFIYFAGILYLLDKLDFEPETKSEVRIGKPIDWNIWMGALIFVSLIGSLPVIYERISIGSFQKSAEVQSVVDLAGLPGVDISNQEMIDLNVFLEKWRSKFIMGYAFYPTQQDAEKINKLPAALRNSSQGTFLTYKLIRPDDLSTVFFSYRKKIDIKNQDLVYLIGCETSEGIIARDMVVVTQDSIRIYHSDLVFESCSDFQ